MYAEDRLIMVEFVVIQKHAFILFISNSYREEIQGTVKFVNLGFVICQIEIRFFTFESYGLYEVEQSGKQLRAQLASWFYAIIGIDEDGIFVSNGAQFHISCLHVCLKLQWRRKIHHDLYMLTFPLIVLVVRASMVRQPLLKPAVLHAFLLTVLSINPKPP
ncbi:putative LL-diaminopimelate aminotransferase [Helianthus annuus]|uniref:LL-diaminopimelate aminotransferase n=1 Tax=Helianthus annuus TaxID=4232 RepID=A0A9K3EP69_HELAN|nr:putative LL-diaminopimelate aminotransferase [Helianthus annuus]